MKYLFMYKIWFVFLFMISMICFYSFLIFIMNDLSIFIEWEIISMNSLSVVMTLLFDWMSLIFMSFVLFISSLVIYYSKEYMSSDYNMGLLSLVSFLSITYTLYLYAYSQHGKFFSGGYSFSMGKIREYLLLFLHWFPLNLLILSSDLCLM